MITIIALTFLEPPVLVVPSVQLLLIIRRGTKPNCGKGMQENTGCH